jgi:hypothetical protein
MRNLENLLHALVAFAFGIGLLVAVVMPVKAESSSSPAATAMCSARTCGN